MIESSGVLTTVGLERCHLRLERIDLVLLLFHRLQQDGDERIVIHGQITIRSGCDRFRQDLLDLLRQNADSTFVRVETFARSIVLEVETDPSNRLNFFQRLFDGLNVLFQPLI